MKFAPLILLLVGIATAAISSSSMEITEDDIWKSYNRHRDDVEKEYESRILRPKGFHHGQKSTRASRKIGKAGIILRRVAEEFGLTNEDALHAINRATFTYGGGASEPPFDCPLTDDAAGLTNGVVSSDGLNYGISCTGDQHNFRNIDGSCNNLKSPHWGRQFQAFRRLFPVSYEDEISVPIEGLPNAREISSTIHTHNVVNDTTITNALMQVGQFIDHDISLAPEDDLHCCEDEYKDNTECFNIDISTTDPFFSTISDAPDCLPITRSTPLCLSSAVREQFNMITSFVDLSNIYGSDEETLAILRGNAVDGLLLEGQNFTGSQPALPTQLEATGTEHYENVEGLFISGDIRVNEMPGLAALHTLYFREHNRLAREIKKANPGMTSDLIFNLARRINIAEWQQVVYGEFLPTVVGPELASKFLLDTNEKDSVYMNWVNPGMLHSFATAAYRFGHTLINGIVDKYKNGAVDSSYPLRGNFFEPDVLVENGGDGLERLLEGLVNQPGQAYDEFITEEITNHLFEEDGDDYGQDLIARNLQRGREHGLQNYAAYRKFCKLEGHISDNWDKSKPNEIPLTLWNKFREIYQSPKDIELFTAGLAETPLPGAVVGPTFGCLISYQFFLMKQGDRFFFTHTCRPDVHKNLGKKDSQLLKNLKQGKVRNFVEDILRQKEDKNCGLDRFTREERDEIRRSSLGNTICANSDTIVETTEFVTLGKSDANRVIPCSERRPLNISVFRTDPLVSVP